jgi:LmbE family N-acetylglucosaminyl deacetylase
MRFAPPASSLLKTDVMFVGAHPDDETGTSATLARYALKEGKSVACIYCTRGEGGGNMVGRQSGAALGILREAELRNSLDILGIRHVYFLDQLDWAYTESFAATLRKWNHEETLSRLVRYIRALKPEVIITMNPAPSPGQHGHHQAAGVLATEAFAAAADPTRFPDQITHEFLETWKVRKLYYGGNGEYTAKIATDVLVRGDKTAAQVAGEAAAQHRSQGFGGFSSGGRPGRPQSFVLARTRVKPRQNETDLLAGLDQPVSGEEILISSPGSDTPEVEVSFVPRPALTYYQEWAASNAVTHISANFSADIPVVAGEWNPIALTVWNHAAHEMDELLAIGLPPNWKAKGIPDRVVLRAGSTKTIRFLVQPASDARLDSGIDAHVGNRLKPINAHALLHPVPLTVAHRLKKLGVLSQLTERLGSVPFVQITTNLIVQGSVTSTNDSSGGFKIGYDSDFLYVQTDVRDDHIISNIAPDDIKGHWRSDSIEICIDKGAAAEDTLNSFKLGVFPFDSSGRVRAARDADANQGLVEETSPRTRLLSFKTEGGYRILAGIPLNDIGVKARKGTALRFNIIIYDGDKAMAVLGENINKSRLAWAPRAGVQGRPEDWGRLVFE